MDKRWQSMYVGRALTRREYKRPGFANPTTEPVADIRGHADVPDPLRSLTADGADQQVITDEAG